MGKEFRNEPRSKHDEWDPRNDRPRAHRPNPPPANIAANGETKQGTVRRMKLDKGFGFIQDAQGGEYFFHRTATKVPFDELQEGTQVTFHAFKSEKGPRAEDVTPIVG